MSDKVITDGTVASAEKPTKSFSFKDTPTYKNANFIFEEVKTGVLGPFNGSETNLDGKSAFEIKPQPVKNLFTGHLFQGTNQILVQDLLKVNGLSDPELFTYADGVEYGIIPKKGSSSVVLTTKNKDGNYNTYRFFPAELAEEFSKGKITAIKYGRQIPNKIEYIRSSIEKENNPEKKDFLKTMLAYAHRDNIYTKSMLKNSSSTFKKEDRIKIVNDYLNTMDPSEKEDFKKTIKGNSAEQLVDEYKEQLFLKHAAVELNKQLEAQGKMKPIVIDARNCTAATPFLGKWLTATSFAKNNPNVSFVTDAASIDAVKEDLTKSIEKSFAENRHTEIFSIGKQASELVKEEMQAFRSKEIATRDPARTRKSPEPDQSIEMDTF